MSGRLVVITDHPWPSVEIEREVLGNAGADVLDAANLSGPQLLEAVRDAHAVMTCFAQVTGEMISGAPDLKVIGRIGVGVDNIDVAAATARSIPVTNVPDYCVAEVTEHAMALLLALRRGTAHYGDRLRRGEWQLDSLRPLRRLAGQTLGVIGLGRIGDSVARAAQGLDMRVIASTAQPDRMALAERGIEAVSLLDLAARADVVSVHAPLTDATRHLVGREFLAAMKSDAVLINVARGGIVDQAALAAALEEKQIGGAGLDVFEAEPLGAGNRLLSAPNTVLTPHVAFYSEESLRDLARLAAENVAAVLDGRAPHSQVNLRPYGGGHDA